ncbi:RNA helicase [Tilletia horrida]|uniref:RNA helicase n=1 Tax=Tilletia horrida TaxID=155126 RepID=A0AAN6GLC6_9BASI|nr:RNA helicase [Tilletia horrida]KAK0562371.1 RNA helicase [Tilletia horrida]
MLRRIITRSRASTYLSRSSADVYCSICHAASFSTSHSSKAYARRQNFDPDTSSHPRRGPPPFRQRQSGKSLKGPTKTPEASTQRTRDALRSEINAFPESTRIAARLVTLGFKGNAIRALALNKPDLVILAQTALEQIKKSPRPISLSSPKHQSIIEQALQDRVPGDDDIELVKRLLRLWRRSATRAFESTNAMPRAFDTLKDHSHHQQNLFDVEGLRQTFSAEGHIAIQRACMNHFLDWIEDRLSKLIHSIETNTVVDRPVQGRRPARAHATAPPSSSRPTISNAPLQPLVQDASAFSVHLSNFRAITDLTSPEQIFTPARALRRQIHLHIGPTNSGKTYGALLALTKATTGMYAGPLRLLAHEVFERINEGSIGNVPPRTCNLLTGEEKKVVDLNAGLQSCTVEMAGFETLLDVAVVDEIQMIGDPGRGHAWTAAVLGLPAKELHLCGEASVLPLIRRLAALCKDDFYIHTYERLTPLRIADESLHGDLSKIKKGDCIVTFARSNIFYLKRMIEQKTGLKCAVAYGALPPETRSEQARRFNDTSENGLDVMVASDAIGMGLNLKIKRIIFETCTKFVGGETVPLSTSQIKQIAGRAGRYGTPEEEEGGKEPPGGVVTTLHEEDLPFVHAALASKIIPIQKAGLDLVSGDRLDALGSLIESTNDMDTKLNMNIWSNDSTEGGSGKGKKQDGQDEDDEEQDGGRRSSRRSKQQPEPPAMFDKLKAKTEALLKVLAPTNIDDPQTRPSWFDPSRSLSTLLSLFQQTVRFDPSLFFLPSLSDATSVSPILDAAGRGQLRVEEKVKLATSPASMKDERITMLLSNFIRGYGRGELVRFEDCARGLDMVEVLEAVEKAMKEKRGEGTNATKEEDAQTTVAQDDHGTTAADSEPANSSLLDADEAEALAKPAATKKGKQQSVLNLNSLSILESLHRGITVYLWLSYRFPLAFCFRTNAQALKLRAEAAIDEILRSSVVSKAGLKKAHGKLDELDLVNGARAKKAVNGDEEQVLPGMEDRIAEETELVARWKEAVNRKMGRDEPAGSGPKGSDLESGGSAEESVTVILGEGAGGIIKDDLSPEPERRPQQ